MVQSLRPYFWESWFEPPPVLHSKEGGTKNSLKVANIQNEIPAQEFLDQHVRNDKHKLTVKQFS